MTSLRAVAYSALIAVVVGCTSQPAFAPRATPVTTPGPAGVDITDTGTWLKSLNATDCSDYLTKMTGAEQLQIARVLLQVMRTTTLPDPPAFSGSLGQSFQQALANKCAEPETGPTYQVIAAATLVYILNPDQYQPPYR